MSLAWLWEPGVLATLIIGAGSLVFLALLVGIVIKMWQR
ncbi:hypothetical protein ABIB48_001560 [Arthrobacter sp. UYCu511]